MKRNPYNNMYSNPESRLNWPVVIISILIAIILGLISEGRAQDKLLDILPMVNGEVIYTDVVNLDSTVKKDELYARAKLWLFSTYKSGKDVLQLEDKENGIITGRGFFSQTWQFSFVGFAELSVWQNITIKVKDGKYKFEIRDLRATWFTPSSTYTSARNNDEPIEYFSSRKENGKKLYSEIDAHIRSLIADLKEGMLKSVSKDDW